jgi:subtilisin family serine protease
LLEQAINDALDAGIILVSSVGNDSAYSILYPSGYQNVIAVSAIGDDDVLASFSNYGGHVDICAPGINLYSALAGIYNWGTWSGTSFAAPLVSGVCALSIERNRETSVSGIIDNIHQTARKQMDWGDVVPVDPRYGYGALDAFNTALSWSRGDCDISGEWDISDIVKIIAYLYLDGQLDSLGEVLADYNCDDEVDISDITALISFLYLDRVSSLPCY